MLTNLCWLLSLSRDLLTGAQMISYTLNARGPHRVGFEARRVAQAAALGVRTLGLSGVLVCRNLRAGAQRLREDGQGQDLGGRNQLMMEEI